MSYRDPASVRCHPQSRFKGCPGPRPYVRISLYVLMQACGPRAAASSQRLL